MINVANLGEKWTPRRLTNLRLWLDASNMSALLDGSSNPITDGATVDHWYCSQFGYDFNAQSTVSKRPVWNSSGFGGKSKPYIQFDGASDILRCIDSNLLASLSGDSQGSIIVIGANSNTTIISISHYVSSFTEALPINGLNLGSRGSSNTYKVGITPWTAGSNRDIYTTQYTVPTNNREVCYFVTSNGSVYDFRAKYSDVSTIVVNVGPNDGNWFADITGRDNVCVGGAKTDVETYYWLRVAEVIITGTNIVDGSNEQKYLEQYIHQKYGTLSGD